MYLGTSFVYFSDLFDPGYGTIKSLFTFGSGHFLPTFAQLCSSSHPFHANLPTYISVCVKLDVYGMNRGSKLVVECTYQVLLHFLLSSS